MASPCPYDGNTARYTDPLLQVRCPTCFNVLNDEPAGTPIGRTQDLEAPMTIQGTATTYVYEQPLRTKYTRY
jgi:hypothetical protein